MGLIFAEIMLSNARNDNLDPMMVNALVDSGALHLCIPQHVANQLELLELDRREVTIANAYRDAQKIKGEGDAQAASIYAEGFGRDPQFAQFYRSLEAYKSSFTKKADVMVVDPSSSEFFKAFRGNALPAAPAKK